MYHSASIWGSADKRDMVLIFGGRGTNGESLNDLWGLRRHSDGTWDWQSAPYRPTVAPPEPRLQHSSVCYKNLFLVIGGNGRQNPDNNNLNLEVFNLQSSEWIRLMPINRFRHSSWLMDGKLFIHGGFEPAQPNKPTGNLFRVNLASVLGAVPQLANTVNAEVAAVSFF